jgi:hypothetical protein
MKTIFELWDFETSNLIDAYATEQDALAEVRCAMEADGWDAVTTWALLRDDRRSSAKAVVAIGTDLAIYATEGQLKAV